MPLSVSLNYGMITSTFSEYNTNSFTPSKTQIPQDLTYTKTYSHSFKTIRTVIKSYYFFKTVIDTIAYHYF